jgi:hypothetical protein
MYAPRKCEPFPTCLYNFYTLPSLWLYSPLDLGRFLSFLILYTVGRTPWTGDEPVARPLPTYRTIKIQIKRTQITMPRVEFEPTIPVFERAKMVHALHSAATVIGIFILSIREKSLRFKNSVKYTAPVLTYVCYFFFNRALDVGLFHAGNTVALVLDMAQRTHYFPNKQQLLKIPVVILRL